MDLKKLLKKLAKKITKYKIDYMIIGGQAVLLYGEPRLTKDIDITLSLNPTQYKKLEKIVKELKLEIIPPNPEQFVKETFVLPTLDPKTNMRIDFIMSFSDYEKQAFKRTNKIKLDNIEINYASLEDIIIHKIISGRPRDIEDIKNILLKNPNFDREYINYWLSEFSSITEKNLVLLFENLVN